MVVTGTEVKEAVTYLNKELSKYAMHCLKLEDKGKKEKKDKKPFDYLMSSKTSIQNEKKVIIKIIKSKLYIIGKNKDNRI